MSVTVEWKGLAKSYGAHSALTHVNGTIAGNKIIGLLGRNGSGKTTLLALIKGLLRPTSGQLLINGQAPFENRALAREICFVRDSRMTYGSFKVREALKLASASWPNWDHGYALHLAERFSLPLEKKVQSLSLGMESSLNAIIGLASRAPLTLMDETYNGMDAPSRYLFYEELLEDYMRSPRMLVLSTHLIEEVGRLFEEVVLVDQGTIVLHETTEQLLMMTYVVIGTAPDVERFTDSLQVLHTQVLGNMKSAVVFGELSKEQERLADLYHLDIQPVPLQDIIVHLTSRKEVPSS
ncbi:ABC-2 type transport system ATP-binding protein [Paenibacillus phyllosphaerae]|uniref:ABC-2 type transport system ATP-binding protein n=1 Tax=Paenibacillus phyllosphaerae TaxID=274593 RepID=A0A7W5ATX0_9BACL|nr:ABC transporter ATP-binding protein [Paenibacillus phyllosphaerae]MBB3108592.1 ABC-2 type transport system ATP-binding protein [Paenibacillus phyllosphaerae]